MPPKKAAAGKKKAGGKASPRKPKTPDAAEVTGPGAAVVENQDLRLQLKMATEDTHDILIENKKVVNNLRQIKAKYAVDDTDKGDILEYRQAELNRKDQRIEELQADLAAAKLEAENCRRIISEMKNKHRDLIGEHEDTAGQLSTTQSLLAQKQQEAASLQDRANEAERLAQELRGLQADLRASSTKVKELTVLNAGQTDVKIVHGDAWVVAVSRTPLNGDRPVLRDGTTLSCCAHGKQLWMHGGVESEEWELNMLSLDSMQWEAPQGLRMPAQVQQAGTVPIHRTKIFSFGGKRGSRLLDEVQILNTSTGEWQSPELVDGVHPSARYGPMLACVQGQVWMFGGCGAEGMLNDTWVYNISKNQWTRIEHAAASVSPTGRAGASLCVDHEDGRLWLFGGNAGGPSLGDLHYLDTHTLMWSQVKMLGQTITAREHHCACMLHHYLVINGGVSHSSQDGAYSLLGDTQVFDTIAKFWACIDEGAWAEDRQLVRKPHAVLTTSYHNRLYTIKPAWGTDELDELQMIDITTPQGIDAMREAHQDDRVIVECLSISPVATCTTNSITISWTPPTKNIDRIVDYKVMMATSIGVVKQVYHGQASRFRMEGLRPHLEFVFCVKASYDDGSFIWSDPQAFRTKS